MGKIVMIGVCFIITFSVNAQNNENSYKKRVLEHTELDILTSFYSQEGEHASVTGGTGTEELTNTPVNIKVSIPIGADNILAIDAGISAYTSASSSNLNPFDGTEQADPNIASSGASKSDELLTAGASFTRYSDDRNHIWSINGSVAHEHDYSSMGFGASYTRLFNKKNTSIGISANVFLDNWEVLYPYELGGPGSDPEIEEVPLFDLSNFDIKGNQNYAPKFKPYEVTDRKSYTVGLSASQIFSPKLQGSINLDFIKQEGQLANHMQRVYFSDVENTFIDNFHLADDVERLPSSRFKTAIGARLNYYINENFVAKSFYRYYFDDWGIQSHTLSLELPIKLPIRGLTVYPSYRFYTQTAADYFAPYDEHLSTAQYYTSDYDLSSYQAHQLGIGLSYTDILGSVGIGGMRFKSIDLKYNNYWRNTQFNADLISLGVKFSFGK